MASTSSSAAPRPAWQEALFSISECRFLSAEKSLLRFFIKRLEKCDPRFFSADNPTLHNNVDIKSPEMIEYLYLIAHIIITESLESLRYYLSEEQAAAILSPSSFLYNVCINSILKHDIAKLNAKFLLPFLFAGIIAAAYQCMFSLVPEMDRAENDRKSHRLVEQCKAIASKAQTHESPIFPQFDKYLTETLGSRLNTMCLWNYFTMGSDALNCFVVFRQSPTSRHAAKCLLQHVGKDIEHLLGVPSEKTEEIREEEIRTKCFGIQSPPLPAALQFQMKVLVWCFTMIPSENPNVADDPLFQEWWRVLDSYLFFLRRAVKSAKEAELAQPMTVASLNRTLMNFLLYGASRDNSGFAEVEKVAKDLASAIRKCEAWAPPSWKLEMEEVLKTRKKFRRWMRDLPPEQLSTVCLVQENSPVQASMLRPGLVLVTLLANDVKAEKMCDAFGKIGKNLLKCSACRSVFYCNSECQKQDWKVHKNDCRELQWAKKEAAA